MGGGKGWYKIGENHLKNDAWQGVSESDTPRRKHQDSDVETIDKVWQTSDTLRNTAQVFADCKNIKFW